MVSYLQPTKSFGLSCLAEPVSDINRRVLFSLKCDTSGRTSASTSPEGLAIPWRGSDNSRMDGDPTSGSSPALPGFERLVVQ
ncbi:unnamed protein product [Protopolystoma xenopodis]|uniref:Uncharacterized protein n=1 Tax=Protopolystoma xenopodis TaxID=117903 RepID=A0A448XGM3_9PLAT|nr:unnamed protein product [Protopolystoma xenopodis]